MYKPSAKAKANPVWAVDSKGRKFAIGGAIELDAERTIKEGTSKQLEEWYKAAPIKRFDMVEKVDKKATQPRETVKE